MSWYRTGTINLTKDSAGVTGVNTKWAQAVNGVMPGMMMIMPDNKLYEIKNVVSDTSLVLVTAYTGATAAAQAYSVVTTYEGDLSQFSARFNALLTAMGGSRADMYNWLTSTAATISVAKDDGTTVTVKTLKAFTDEQAKFATKNADGVVPVSQGGTGAKDEAGIRKNAGLGTSSTKDIGVAAGNVMAVGTFGIGSQNPGSPVDTLSCFIATNLADGPWAPGNGAGFQAGYAANRLGQLFMQGSALRFRYNMTGNAIATKEESPWITVYSTANTTKASDGTLKAASPVARIACPDEGTRLDIDEDGFEWCGYGVANDRARGIEIIQDGVGVYRITGAKSLASSGWRLLPPRDPDGSGDLGVVTAEQSDDEIVISLFRRKMVLVDGEIVIQPGEPIDVPANSWIDARLDMPEPVIPLEPVLHSENERSRVQPE